MRNPMPVCGPTPLYRRKERGKLFPRLLANSGKGAVQSMRTARWLKIGLVILGAMLLLACNPFGDDDEDRPDQVQVVEVGNQISSESSNRSNQFNQAPPTNAQEETAPTEGSGDLESQRESSSV